MDIITTKKTNAIAPNVSINCHTKKANRLLYFPCSFISDHITIDKYFYLLLLCKT